MGGTAILEPQTKKSVGLRPGVPVRYGTDWYGYMAVSGLVGDRRLRTFFCDGEMEILMPSVRHELWIALLGQLVEMLTLELQIPMRCLGMTTFRREDLDKGLEPDRCYYLTNEAKICGKLALDLSVDPPPDLALEVEITSSVEKRMRVYAGLGVPEVWRFDEAKLTVNQLVTNGEYVVSERSRYFPMLPMSGLVQFLRMYDKLDDTAIRTSFRDYVRSQIAAGWPEKSGEPL